MKSIKRIILEMSKAILEAKEHTDDEIVDFDEINLQHEYDKLNALLFQGSLQPVQMIWNTRRSAHGTVKATRNRMTGQITIRSLGISKFLDVPYKVFKDTLAHEMIHVYLLQQGIDDGHGWRFIREMNRINSMGHGFNVSVRLDSSQFELSRHAQAKAKDMVFILMETNLKKNMLAVTSPVVFQREGKEIEALYSKLIRSGRYGINWAKGEFYSSNNPKLLKYSAQRTFRTKFGYVIINQELADELKSGARLIGSFKVE